MIRLANENLLIKTHRYISTGLLVDSVHMFVEFRAMWIMILKVG